MTSEVKEADHTGKSGTVIFLDRAHGCVSELFVVQNEFALIISVLGRGNARQAKFEACLFFNPILYKQ